MPPFTLTSGEDVARAAHGDDPPWMLGVVLDRRADPRDVHIDAAVEGFEARTLSIN